MIRKTLCRSEVRHPSRHNRGSLLRTFVSQTSVPMGSVNDTDAPPLARFDAVTVP